MVGVWFEYGRSMAGVWQEYGNTISFSRWVFVAMISLILIFGFLCRSSIFPNPSDGEILYSNVLVLRAF